MRLTDKGQDVVRSSHDWLLSSLQDVPDARLGDVADVLRSIADRLNEQSRRMAGHDEEPSAPVAEEPTAR